MAFANSSNGWSKPHLTGVFINRGASFTSTTEKGRRDVNNRAILVTHPRKSHLSLDVFFSI